MEFVIIYGVSLYGESGEIKMYSFKRLVSGSFLFALVLLSGCGPTQEQIATQTATAHAAPQALQAPTSTLTRTPVLSATPNTIPTQTPANDLLSTPTLALTQMTINGKVTSFTLKEVTFSIVVPEGWSTSIESNRIVLIGPTIAGIQTFLTFSLDQFDFMGTALDADLLGIAMFSAHVQDTLAEMTQNLVSGSEDFLETPDGTPYFRWIMEHNTNGRNMHQAFYFFGSGKWFLTVMYGRAKSGGGETDTLIDETIKTLKFEE